MSNKESTFRVNQEELKKIKSLALEQGMTIGSYINYILDKKIPVDNVPPQPKMDKSAPRIGLNVPGDIWDRMEKNRSDLTTRFRKISIQDFVYCLVLGGGDQG